MENKKKLKNLHSFAVLAYGESLFLENCISSLKKQTVESDIFICTSTPSEFLTKIATIHKIPIYLNEKSAGIASDWSFAYQICQTQYLTLTHQDDLYLPDYTRNCLKSLKKEETIIFFTDYSEIVNEQIRRNTLNFIIKKLLLFCFIIKPSIQSTLLKKKLLYFGSPICCPSVMYNKELIGDFYFSDEFKVSLDWDAWLRLVNKKGYFTYINLDLVQHRIHQESQTTKQINNNQRSKEDYKILRKIWPKYLADFFFYLYSFSQKNNHL